MTTAHRPTWKSAVGQGSESGGWTAGGAVSHLRSALDAPGHTRLKVRPYDDVDVTTTTTTNDIRSARLEASLAAILEAEKSSVSERIGKRKIDPAIEERAQLLLLANTAEIDVERIKSKYDDADILDDDDDDDEKEESDLDDDEDVDLDNDDSTDDDDQDDEAALQAELAKIRAEREAAKQKAQAVETAQQEEAAAVLGNPLLVSGGGGASASTSGKLKRRWNDDVVFRNQAKVTTTTLAAPKKRFINDTVRNDFHKRFLNKFIR